MVGWHHPVSGHGFGQTLGVGDGQGSLACCGSWGCKQSDTTERLNWNWDVYIQFALEWEKAMAPHSSTLAWTIPWMEEPLWAAVHGVAKSRT